MKLISKSNIEKRNFRGSCMRCSSVYEEPSSEGTNVIHRNCLECGERFPLYEQKDTKSSFFIEFFKQFQV